MNIGVDIVNVNRIRNIYKKYNKRFVDNILTDIEKQKPISAEYIAKCWAVKEACVKASGVTDFKRFSYSKDG